MLSYADFEAQCLAIVGRLGGRWTWRAGPSVFGRAGRGCLVLDRQPLAGRVAVAAPVDGGVSESLEDPAVEAAEAEAEDGAAVAVARTDQVPLIDAQAVWSSTFGVPVLYFRVMRPDGSVLALDDVLALLPEQHTDTDGRRAFVTQGDHPIDGSVHCFVHPCETAAFMDVLLGTSPRDQYVRVWLSAVARAVGIKVPHELFVPA